MADLSKVKVLNTTYDLKDAQSRAQLTTLLSKHDLAALGDAAWLGVDSGVTENGTGVVSSGKIKEYVDAQVASIDIGEVVIDEAKGGAGADKDQPKTAASATTYRKLYLVPSDKATGTYVEWLTIRSGSADAYTYTWEQIGSTALDISGYVKKTQTIAGVDLQDNITVPELQGALELGKLAYVDTASGTVEGQTINGVKATGELSAALTGDLGETDATATITSKAAFTPSGEIKLDGEAQGTNNKVLKGGSISVTVKDAATATAVTDITYNAYTPAGSVSLTKDNNNGTFQVSGTISKPDVTVDDSSTDTFVKSLVAGDVDAASFDINKFHGGAAASLGAGFYTAGSDASLSEGAQASLTEQVKGDFVSQAIYVEANGYDAATETLTFSAAPTAKAVTDRGTFTPNTLQALSGGKATVIDTSAFNGGAAASIDSDIFVAQKLPVVGNTASAVTAVTAALAATPEFTGDKFTPAFTGTADNIKFAGAKYLKQEIDTASFTPTEGTLSFAGSEQANLIPTAISYKKTTIGSLGASAALPVNGLDVGDITISAKKVTVSPNAE